MLNRFRYLTYTRFLTNLNDKTLEIVKKELPIDEDEQILLLIDNSFFINKKHYYILTNKRILLKNDMINLRFTDKNGIDEESNINVIETSRLNHMSVYVNRIGKGCVLTILDETHTLNLNFKNITNPDVLKVIFMDYLANYSGGYTPTYKVNDKKYKKIEKEIIKKNYNVFGTILNILTIIAAGILFMQDYFPLYGVNNETIKYIVIFILIGKLISSFTVRSKSTFSNLVLLSFFALFYQISMFETNLKLCTNYGIYIILSILFMSIDFDRLLKIVILFFSFFISIYLSYILLAMN